MLAAILRLFALRPLLSLAIFGIPVIVLIIVGLFAIAIVKLLVFVVLPLLLLFWVLRRLFRHDRGPGAPSTSPPSEGDTTVI